MAICARIADSEDASHICICTQDIDHAGMDECRECGRLF